MDNKVHTSLRIDAQLKERIEKIAKYEHRKFVNLVEKLLIQEVDRYMAAGFDFDMEVQTGAVVEPEKIVAGVDEDLAAEFEKFMKKAK